MVHRYQPTRSQASLRTPGLYKLWVVFTEGTELFSCRNRVWVKKNQSYNVVICIIFPVVPCSSFCFFLPSKQQTSQSAQQELCAGVLPCLSLLFQVLFQIHTKASSTDLRVLFYKSFQLYLYSAVWEAVDIT